MRFDESQFRRRALNHLSLIPVINPRQSICPLTKGNISSPPQKHRPFSYVLIDLHTSKPLSKKLPPRNGLRMVTNRVASRRHRETGIPLSDVCDHPSPTVHSRAKVPIDGGAREPRHHQRRKLCDTDGVTRKGLALILDTVTPILFSRWHAVRGCVEKHLNPWWLGGELLGHVQREKADGSRRQDVPRMSRSHLNAECTRRFQTPSGQFYSN